MAELAKQVVTVVHLPAYYLVTQGRKVHMRGFTHIERRWAAGAQEEMEADSEAESGHSRPGDSPATPVRLEEAGIALL